jgi:hypothetical protein
VLYTRSGNSEEGARRGKSARVETLENRKTRRDIGHQEIGVLEVM